MPEPARGALPGAAPPDGGAAADGGSVFDGQYRIKLESFEGPLDLLLHLIQQHELDILDIPVSFITEKYLEYLKLMQVLSIEIASEYLVMAATLVHIKSKMLLPAEPTDQEDGMPAEEEEDPRAELVRRLLEYQKYKAAAADLAERGTLGRDVFPRGVEEAPPPGPAEFAKVEVFSLLEAFERILKKAKVKIDHEVVFDRISITDRIVELTEKLEGRRAVRFEWLFLGGSQAGPPTRFDLVITFLAMLEMCRMKLLRVYQTGPLAPIYMGLVEEQDDLSEEDRQLADREAEAKLSGIPDAEPAGDGAAEMPADGAAEPAGDGAAAEPAGGAAEPAADGEAEVPEVEPAADGVAVEQAEGALDLAAEAGAGAPLGAGAEAEPTGDLVAEEPIAAPQVEQAEAPEAEENRADVESKPEEGPGAEATGGDAETKLAEESGAEATGEEPPQETRSETAAEVPPNEDVMNQTVMGPSEDDEADGNLGALPFQGIDETGAERLFREPDPDRATLPMIEPMDLPDVAELPMILPADEAEETADSDRPTIPPAEDDSERETIPVPPSDEGVPDVFVPRETAWSPEPEPEEVTPSDEETDGG
jgi:segregation and condensation protein A